MAEALRKKTVKFENNSKNIDHQIQQIQQLDILIDNEDLNQQIVNDINQHDNNQSNQVYGAPIELKSGGGSLAFDSQKIKQNIGGPQQIYL